MALNGIDISEHNGEIDLTPYVGKFAIIRAAWACNEDKMWRRNVTECQRLGIPFGLYLYSYATSVEEAGAEANFFLALTSGLDIKIGNWFDMEDADGWKSNHGAMDADLISAMCNKFCSIVEAAGRYVGIYSSESWFGNWIVGCDAYDKWVASWGNNDGNVNRDTSNMGTMLQYTSNGGQLDENLMYVDISTYDMSGKNLAPIPAPTPVPEPEPQPAPATSTSDGNSYVVQAGDTLSAIADKFSTTYQQIAADNAIEDPNVIYPGQVLRIGGSAAPAPSENYEKTISVGNRVIPCSDCDYDGTQVTKFQDTYTVSEINGDRAVLVNDNGDVWCAMHISNLRRD